MRHIIDPQELEQTLKYMDIATEIAKQSTCQRSQRGVVIVKNNKIIATGYNKPTLPHLCCQREHVKSYTHIELCNAIHAEELALLNCIGRKVSLKGAVMYHMKVKDGKRKQTGPPSCTNCSKKIHEMGLEFVLWHKEGYVLYEPKEFDELSFDYFLKK